MHARLSTACFSTVWGFAIAIEEFGAVLEQSQMVAAAIERTQDVRLTNCVAEDPGSRIQPLVLAAHAAEGPCPRLPLLESSTTRFTSQRFARMR